MLSAPGVPPPLCPFIPGLLIEHLLCTRRYARSWQTHIHKADVVPISTQLTLSRGS
uniref:Uncharacterized protein n=1 Tax=Neovison vison TaxID=452646 RepID=A0A8C7B1B3_NEOVI